MAQVASSSHDIPVSTQDQAQDQGQDVEPKPKLKISFKKPSVKLLSSQPEHVDKVLKILKKSPIALDLSMLGTGKTYTSSYVAQAQKYTHVIVICPLSMKGKWEMMRTEYGIPIYDIYTYCGLRSSKCRQPKHGLLHRRDYQVSNYDSVRQITVRVDKVEFNATDEYKRLVKEGALLILDEIQNVKNLGSQFLACQALIKYITTQYDENRESGGEDYLARSRAILLSGSPIDKEEQVVHFFRLINLMKTDSLSEYNPYTEVNVWQGFKNILDYMMLIDPVKTSMLNYLPLNTGKSKEFVSITYKLFQKVYKPSFSSTMPPFLSNYKIDKVNAFYECDPDAIPLLKKGTDLLGKASSYNPDTGTVMFARGGGSFAAIQQALIMIETAKIGTIMRIVRYKLKSNPNMKVVVCVNYLDTIADLAQYLSDLSPLVLTGAINDRKRRQLLQEFQQPNTDHRLLIANTTVCGAGIDLDDQHGNYPRFCLVNPNYSTIMLYQVCHRIYRKNTMSDSTVQFLYMKEHCELRILEALARKSAIMKETTAEQSDVSGIKFPCDFEGMVENGITGLDTKIREYYYDTIDRPMNILSI